MNFDVLKLFVFSAAVLLGACAEMDIGHVPATPSDFISNPKPSIVSEAANPNITAQQAENFSTSGKATRLFSTPSGPAYLYDISQDAEVRQAIEELYAQGNMTFGDVSFPHYNAGPDGFFAPELKVTPAALLLKNARQIAYYDLFRSSCKKVERVPCGNGYSGWGADYRSECPSCNLGKIPDSGVEEIWFSYTRVTEKILTEDDIAKGRWVTYPAGAKPTTAYIDECRHISKEPLLKYFYIGEKSGYSLEQVKDFLLHYECVDE